jgi:hypothetical protein
MLNKVAAILIGPLSVVACDQMSSPASPSAAALTAPASSNNASRTPSSAVASRAQAADNGQTRVEFSLNGDVSGFPTGQVSLTGGGSYDRFANLVHAGGGFRCLASVLQGPLSISINPNTPGPCLEGEGVRWDTDALLPSVTFKCTGAAGEPLKTALTSDTTVVLQADFYRASNGNDESFTAKMIVSDGDIAADFPGVNLWVQGVGCGVAKNVNFGR